MPSAGEKVTSPFGDEAFHVVLLRISTLFFVASDSSKVSLSGETVSATARVIVTVRTMACSPSPVVTVSVDSPIVAAVMRIVPSPVPSAGEKVTSPFGDEAFHVALLRISTLFFVTSDSSKVNFDGETVSVTAAWARVTFTRLLSSVGRPSA